MGCRFNLAVCLWAVLTACGSSPAPRPEPQPQEQAGNTEPRASFAKDTGQVGDPVAYRIIGNEPFWAGELNDSSVRYSTPENIGGTVIPGSRSHLADGRIGFTGVQTSGHFELELIPRPCSDGMSDRTYPFAAVLLIGGEQRQGCAAAASDPLFDRE